MAHTVDMKAMQKLVDTADLAFEAWKAAGSYALTQHAGYSAALKTNAAARAASETLRGYANGILTQLHSDPDTAPWWFPKIGAIRDKAIYQTQTLDAAKELVLADLAKNAQNLFGAGASKFQTREDAAAAVDSKMKTAGDGNRKTPGKQDSSLPPVDVPPETGDPSWTRYAGFAAAGALLLWIARKVF